VHLVGFTVRKYFQIITYTTAVCTVKNSC